MSDIPCRKAKKMKDLHCPSDNFLCKPKVPSVPLCLIIIIATARNLPRTDFPYCLCSEVHLLIHPVLKNCSQPVSDVLPAQTCSCISHPVTFIHIKLPLKSYGWHPRRYHLIFSEWLMSTTLSFCTLASITLPDTVRGHKTVSVWHQRTSALAEHFGDICALRRLWTDKTLTATSRSPDLHRVIAYMHILSLIKRHSKSESRIALKAIY